MNERTTLAPSGGQAWPAADPLSQVRFRTHGLPGVLVTVDGCDGTGKTTLLEGLERALLERGAPLVRTRQPTTEARQLAAFETYLFRPEERDRVDYRALLCMMIGDRLQHLHQVVLPALSEGAVVLCDRYIYTQMVTTRTRGHDDEPWMYELYPHVVQPDVDLITYAPLDVVCARIGARADQRESFFETDHVRRNLEAYCRVGTLFGAELLDTGRLSADAALAHALALVEQELAGRVAPAGQGG